MDHGTQLIVTNVNYEDTFLQNMAEKEECDDVIMRFTQRNLANRTLCNPTSVIPSALGDLHGDLIACAGYREVDFQYLRLTVNLAMCGC